MRKTVRIVISSIIIISCFVSAKVSAFEKPVAGIAVAIANYQEATQKPLPKHEPKKIQKEYICVEEPVAGISVTLDNYYETYEGDDATENLSSLLAIVGKEYDIPLSGELQQYVGNLCEKEYPDVTPEMVFAVMDKESDFDPDAVHRNKNGSKDVGIMQINSRNHAWLREELDVTDFFDPKQNILSGVYMLSIYGGKKDLHKTFVSYNAGPDEIYELYDRGIYSSSYSREVVRIMEKLKYKKI